MQQQDDSASMKWTYSWTVSSLESLPGRVLSIMCSPGTGRHRSEAAAPAAESNLHHSACRGLRANRECIALSAGRECPPTFNRGADANVARAVGDRSGHRRLYGHRGALVRNPKKRGAPNSTPLQSIQHATHLFCGSKSNNSSLVDAIFLERIERSLNPGCKLRWCMNRIEQFGGLAEERTSLL